MKSICYDQHWKSDFLYETKMGDPATRGEPGIFKGRERPRERKSIKKSVQKTKISEIPQKKIDFFFPEKV